MIAEQEIKKIFDDARHEEGVLLGYQIRWIADQHDVKVCEKSRRVGISWAEASDDALYSASEIGDDTWYIGYTKDMAREFIDDCAFWAHLYKQAAEDVNEFVFVDQEDGQEDRQILAYRINFASGHKIVALSSAPRNLRGKQGRVVFGVDMKIVDGDGRELPRDGSAAGDLLVRGPWIVSSYFKQQGASPLVDGWFPTGDVAKITADGVMQITDRSKDVIKSGGEWIGSIDLENIAMAHPAVAMAACIAAFHPKWDERPLLVVVQKPGMTVSRDELIAFFDGKIAKWWTPDDVVFVESIPLGATGKMLKHKLRDQFKTYQLPTA